MVSARGSGEISVQRTLRFRGHDLIVRSIHRFARSMRKLHGVCEDRGGRGSLTYSCVELWMRLVDPGISNRSW